MLYGHVHDTQDQRLLERFQGITSETTFLNTQGETQHIPCNMINRFCMYSNYQPLTLDEWIACDKNRKQKSCQNVKRYEKEPSKTGRLKVFIVVYDFLGMSTVPSVSIKDRIASEFC